LLAPLLAWAPRRAALLEPGLVRSGAVLGVLLCAGYGFQTAGLQFTTPARAAFITGLSVVIVPLLSTLVLRRGGLPAGVWLGVALATLGLALLAFGLAEATYGNGLIAAFVAGVALGVQERELPVTFAHFNENVTAVFTVITFVLFGALIVDTGYKGNVGGIVAFIPFALLVARPASVWLAFLGSDLPRSQRLFVAWFGPKGVASMLFALFVLGSAVPGRSQVFEVASYVILASIAAHGLTDTVGARWIERRIEGAAAGRPSRARIP
jgi:NhaP-type Na+/H+ and K+/H+ antiporter